MAMKYEDLSPRTREQADDMDKDDVEWNKAIKETLEDLTENPFTQRSESQIREQHNEIEFFRMTF